MRNGLGRCGCEGFWTSSLVPGALLFGIGLFVVTTSGTVHGRGVAWIWAGAMFGAFLWS